LHSKVLSAPVTGYGESLLSPEELTVERFANWIALNGRLDGLASAVHELGEGSVQSQVLVDTSLVEGLHRRLPYEQLQFPTASGGACERVKKAARDAAFARAEAEKGIDPNLVRTAVKDAVCHFEDVGYRTRAQEITDKVTSVVPELAESVPDLAGKLTAARNDITHHLVLNDEKEPLADRIDRWVVVSYVTPWLLRLLLLLHAGIEPDALHRACLGSERFGFVRANVAAIARDLGWLPAADLCALCWVPSRSARTTAGTCYRYDAHDGISLALVVSGAWAMRVPLIPGTAGQVLPIPWMSDSVVARFAVNDFLTVDGATVSTAADLRPVSLRYPAIFFWRRQGWSGRLPYLKEILIRSLPDCLDVFNKVLEFSTRILIPAYGSHIFVKNAF
jgi:hypothetical protein